jgi:large subunit ribosomal protein L3
MIGRKIGMTQVFDEKNGNRIPITVIQAGPCVVVYKKTTKKDGYDSLQVGFGDIKLKYKKKKRNAKFKEKPVNVTLAMQGHFSKNDVAPKKKLCEFCLDNVEKYKIGDVIKVDKFQVGEKVDVSGVSKGKGTAGVVKRWNFSRLRETHGTGPCARVGGSIGSCSNPSRVFKGKKMAGRMGNERITVLNLKVVNVDLENNLISLRGAVPGSNGSILTLRSSIKTLKEEKKHA